MQRANTLIHKVGRSSPDTGLGFDTTGMDPSESKYRHDKLERLFRAFDTENSGSLTESDVMVNIPKSV